jgi:hypothetical protein
MKPRHYAQAAALVFLAGAVFAIVHRATGSEYRHFVHWQNVVVDVALAVIWLAGAVACLVRRPMAAFFAVLVAALVTHLHGWMFSVSAPGTGYGVPFLLASVLVPYLLARSAPAWREVPAAGEERHGIHWMLHRPRHA